jgi:hypothetical protein
MKIDSHGKQLELKGKEGFSMGHEEFPARGQSEKVGDFYNSLTIRSGLLLQ